MLEFRLETLKEKICKDIPNFELYKTKVFHLFPILSLSAKDFSLDEMIVSAIVTFTDHDGKHIQEVKVDGDEFSFYKSKHRRYWYSRDNQKRLGKFIEVPPNAAEVNCRYAWIAEQHGKLLIHNILFSLNSNNINTLFSPHHVDLRVESISNHFSIPRSFFSLNNYGIIGCASNVDEIKTLPRFTNQIISYHQNCDDTEIEEKCALTSVSLASYINLI
ncbi:MAG: hypothetical protein HAW67_00810 [Endozoicomonadaceae bacterium]|nr:hypothetical protein [Endozoicomonadaceae bacterium]